MKMEDLVYKQQRLEQRVSELKGKENKTKRKTVYNQLVKIKRALECPEKNVIDPEIKAQKRKRDMEKRI